jgi:enamine deaminase RidA (YjgF/YER057c/UK114 family)
MPRQTVSSGGPYEAKYGYARAVKIGPYIAVSGTTATGAGGTVIGVGDPYTQMRQALATVEDALKRCGASFRDVIRTRTYTTDIARWPEIARAHAEVFGDVRPATTGVVVELLDPRWLVEIEVDAVLP